MERAYSMHRGEEKFVENFNKENLVEETTRKT
jgi:hypothetical protein